MKPAKAKKLCEERNMILFWDASIRLWTLLREHEAVDYIAPALLKDIQEAQFILYLKKV